MQVFSEQYDSETEQLFATAQHVAEAAARLGLDTSAAFGLSSDMEASQLQSIADTLADALEKQADEDKPDNRGICPVTGRRCVCGKLA